MAEAKTPRSGHFFDGKLGADPQLRYSTSGTPVCEFSIAYNTRGSNHPKNKVIWLNCVAFNEMAEHIAENYRKGSIIKIAQATMDQDEWTDKTTRQKRTKFKFQVWELDEAAGQSQVRGDEPPPFNPDDDVPY